MQFIQPQDNLYYKLCLVMSLPNRVIKRLQAINCDKQNFRCCCDKQNSECCGDTTSTPFVYDFTQGYNPADFNFDYSNDDGVATQSPVTGLTVNSNPFTFASPDPKNDHPKWLAYYKTPFPLSDCHEVVFETNIAAQQYFPTVTEGAPPEAYRDRIRNVNDDIRLASGAFNLIDLESYMVFDFFISNTAIYAFYERLPFGKTLTHDYAAFSNAIWVARRSGVDPLQEFVRLAIGIHRGKGIVTWYVDGTPVFSINRIGYRANEAFRLLEHGGDEEIVKINSMYMGFGTFSLLDMAMPYNYYRGLVQQVPAREEAASALLQLEPISEYRELFPDPLTGAERAIVDPAVTWAVPFVGVNPPSNFAALKNWGQGAAIDVKYISVYSRSPCAELEVASVNF